MGPKATLAASIIAGAALSYALMYINYPQLIFIAGILVGAAAKRLIHASAASLAPPLIALAAALAGLQASNPYGFSQALSALGPYLAIYTAYICASSVLGGVLGYLTKLLKQR